MSIIQSNAIYPVILFFTTHHNYCPTLVFEIEMYNKLKLIILFNAVFNLNDEQDFVLNVDLTKKKKLIQNRYANSIKLSNVTH